MSKKSFKASNPIPSSQKVRPRVLFFDDSYRLRKCFFQRPPSRENSFVQIFPRNFNWEFLRPLTYTLSLSFVGNFSGAAPVFNLFESRGPSAICWRIWAIIFDSLKSQSVFKRCHHVFRECRKIIPSFAMLYSSATIITKIGVARIVASLPHSYPSSIKLTLPPTSITLRRSVFVMNTINAFGFRTSSPHISHGALSIS